VYKETAERAERVRQTRTIGFRLLVAGLGLCIHASAQTPAGEARFVENYGKLPLSFEPDTEQADKSVRFLSRGNGYGLYLTRDEAVLALREGRCAGQLTIPRSEAACSPQTAVVRMRLEGRSGSADPAGEEQLPGLANYFIGNDPSKWRTSVPTYARVRYRSVYPGVDLLYYGNQRQLEFDFVVAPAADPKPIAMHFDGAAKLRIGAAGDLVVTTAYGPITFHKPLVYQLENGQRKPVEGGFRLLAGNTVGFRLGSYDRAKPLVIDPVLVYSTYLGGTSSDSANAIATDAQGNVYVTGSAESIDFPLTQGVIQNTNHAPASGFTAFVAKFNPTGTALIYSTYLGGSGGELGNGLAVDASGNVYIAGTTASRDFPVTKGAFQTTTPGGATGFVARLNSTGSALVYATYLGGSGSYLGGDYAMAVAADSAGNAYVTGAAFSSNFPVTAGVLQTQNHAGQSSNAFVTKVNPAGTALIYSTYLGGTGHCVFSIGPQVFYGDIATGLSVDSAGYVYTTGYTYSGDFPATAGALQPKNNAYQNAYCGNPGSNAFVAKLNPNFTALVYSTYLGGSGDDRANGLAVDSTGNAYVTGRTSSTDFPVTPGAFQTHQAAPAGHTNAFVARLNPSGGALVYSSYLGGSGSDTASGLAVDGSGDAYVAGQSSSSDFPVTQGAFQTASNSAAGANAFVAEMNPAGALVYSTYLGGSGSDGANGLTVDGTGNVYVTGQASSVDFPVTPGAFQPANRSANKGSNVFVAKLQPAATLPAPSITPGRIVPIYSNVNTIAPDEFVSVFGANLASSTVIGNFRKSLGGTSVTIDGKAAYLIYVSPTQINLQAPDDMATGPVTVVVTTASGMATATVTLAAFAPSFCLLDTKHVAGIILRRDGSGGQGGGTYDILGPTGNSLGYPTVAAKAGDIVELFAVGLGPTTPAVQAGGAFSGAAPTNYPVTLLIGNTPVIPLFAGFSSANLDQINLVVPAGLGAGDMSLVATVGGAQTPAGFVISLQ